MSVRLDCLTRRWAGEVWMVVLNKKCTVHHVCGLTADLFPVTVMYHCRGWNGSKVVAERPSLLVKSWMKRRNPGHHWPCSHKSAVFRHGDNARAVSADLGPAAISMATTSIPRRSPQKLDNRALTYTSYAWFNLIIATHFSAPCINLWSSL